MNATSRAPSSTLVRLLLIDASPDDRRLISDLLDSIPATRFLVDCAPTPADGLDRLQRAEHDACLLDLHLPDTGGLEMIASVESLGRQLPIVVLADRSASDLDHQAMILGAAAFLDKSLLDPATLDRTLRYVIHQRKVMTGLARQAFWDETTSLVSRALYQDRLNRALAFARRRDRQVAAMMIDLAFDPDHDHDEMTIDAALAAAGRRLIGGLRETDSVARLADRRLGLLIEGMHTLDHAATVARKALRTLRAPLDVDGASISVTPSIGVAVYPHEGGEGDMLMRRADAALRRAVAEGGGCCRFASDRIDCEAREVMVLEKAFTTAFEHRDLCLRFHPEMQVAKRIPLLAAEVFWRHPDRGWLPLGDTQADSDDETLIKGITDWSLAAAAEQLLIWRREGLELPRLSITIPFRHISTLSFLERTVTEEIVPRKIAPDRIELDLHGSLILGDAKIGSADLVRLEATGIRLALDAFGKGRIAIQDLRHDLLDSLKLAPELYRDLPMPNDDRGETLLGALIDLGHHLGLTVTAKGAANQHQFDLLKRLGCDAVQLAALPAMSASAADTWLRTLSADDSSHALKRGTLPAEILVPKTPTRGRTEAPSPPTLTPD